MEQLIQPIETNLGGPHANQSTPGCSGIMETHYYKATLLSSDNIYLDYPCEVEVAVWVFGSSGSWASYNVRTLDKRVWVRARGAQFKNVVPIPKPEFNP